MNNEDKIYDLLEKVYIELQDTKKELKDFKDKTNSRFDGVNIKVDANHKEVLSQFKEIKEHIHELDTKNAANHIATNTRLDKISDDLDFLTHKEFQTEKEVFKLKRKLVK